MKGFIQNLKHLSFIRIEGQDIVTLSLILVYRFVYISLPSSLLIYGEVGNLLDHFQNKVAVNKLQVY